jgi:hypothetical protein
MAQCENQRIGSVGNEMKLKGASWPIWRQHQPEETQYRSVMKCESNGGVSASSIEAEENQYN